ncbi:putative introduces a single-strand break via transesterification at a target site in duplex DNA [Lyophyllum shimeji]|uniref:DNA topoisomerase n=1 Tax=Lyophyllum shimeji TaxID=47721 RepID=A0A9P3PIU9_LYOSH|nr:putative introduces a single-strand break via transesterification at a target site in duplex DNA [Lyophyllum shimeji]
MRVLCVAEKPSISKAISQILSGGQFTTHGTRSQYIKNYEFNYPQTNSFFVVTCVTGHLTGSDFPDTHRKWNSCDAFELFDAPIETKVAADNKAIEENLLNQARRADTLMIWTDCDREGEHIGLEIVRVCRRAKRNIVVKRARFSAIIAQQIHRAAQHPVELDRAQADAVEARITLDLKVGAAFTRMQTLILQNHFAQLANANHVVSYGPCQFPTLGFVVQKWNLVKSFVAEPFWYIYLSFTRRTSEGEEETVFNWKRGHLFDEDVAVSIYDFVLTDPLARVMNVTKKETKKWKPLPLTTVELQKAGSRLLRLAPKKVLDIAEKLYQQGFLSYPRTETDQFDPQFDFQSLIQKQTVDPAWGQFATSLNQGGFAVPRKGKNNDKAHPPIHPTAYAGNLAGDEKKVYEFITRRFLACCSIDAKGFETTVDVECGGEHFSATGLLVLERNYLEVYPYEKWLGHELPNFEEGEEFQPSVCELREGRTSKPKLLTEADLVTLMDKNGIGTDATIAQHIQTIIDRDYVIEQMEGNTKYLIPSKLGIGLIEGYNQIGLDKSLSKPQLRRETERSMVQVCERAKTKADMLEEAIEQYKEMFIIARREFQKVVSSVRRYLEGSGGEPGEGEGQNGPGVGGGGGGRGGGGRGGGGGGRGGAGRGGRQAPGSRGTAAPRRRGAGRRGGDEDDIIMNPGSDDDFDPPPPPPARRSRTQQAPPRSSSRQAGPSTSAKPASTRAPSSSHLGAGPSKPASVRQPTLSTNGATGDLQCHCGLPATQETVVSDSASKGRKFWACGNNKSCDFFRWAQPAVDGPQVIPAKRSYSAQQGAGSGNERLCKCNLPAAQRTVTKESENKGRTFWACPNGKSQDGGCGFFEWDEAPETGGLPTRAPRSNVASATSGECFKCNQPGHWAANCPSDGSSNKRQRSFGSSNNGPSSTVTCYKCHQEGHLSTACPDGDNARFTAARGGGSSADACFKCGKTGHWSNACPGEVASRSTSSGRGHERKGRGRGTTRGTTKAKRGRGGKKKSSFGAPDF